MPCLSHCNSLCSHPPTLSGSALNVFQLIHNESRKIREIADKYESKRQCITLRLPKINTELCKSFDVRFEINPSEDCHHTFGALDCILVASNFFKLGLRSIECQGFQT